MWDASHEQIVRMDGLIKNLVEPARSEEDLPVSAVTEVPLSEIVQTRVQTFIRLQNRKTKYENRGTRPRFSCIYAANAISCALPRSSVSLVKMVFLDKLRRTSQDVRLSLSKYHIPAILNNSRASAR